MLHLLVTIRSILIILGRFVAKQLQVVANPLQTARASMKMKAKKDNSFAKFEEEITVMIASLNQFIAKVEDGIAEATAAAKLGDADEIGKMLVMMDAFQSSSGHHLGGAKAATKRCSAMLS